MYMPDPAVLRRLSKERLLRAEEIRKSAWLNDDTLLRAQAAQYRVAANETVYETTNRVCDRHEMPTKDYPFSGILKPSKVELNYTAAALLIASTLYLAVEVLK
ncbi:MAG TPA: hypothetical protein VN666_21770 [Nitrospira sp.]|nr:hypothetical protein [Nitrospira sp.]